MHIEPHNIQPLLDRYKEAGIKAILHKPSNRIYFPDYVWQTEMGTLKAYIDLDFVTVSFQREKDKFNTAWNLIISDHYKEAEYLYNFTVLPTSLVTEF